MQETAKADADAIQAWSARVRTVLAKAADPHDYKPWVQVTGREVPLLKRARPEVLDDDITFGRKLPEQRLTFPHAQVEGHALTTPALDRPGQRIQLVRIVRVSHKRADLAHEVALVWLLNLDDFRALLAE
jgi:hypothetical protein